MSKTLVIGTVVVVVVVFALGGFLLWQQTSRSQPMQPVVQQTSPSPPMPSPQPQTLDTSAWQAYRSDEFGFEVRYPRDWKVKELEELGTFNLGLSPSDVEEIFSVVQFSILESHKSSGTHGEFIPFTERDLQDRMHAFKDNIREVHEGDTKIGGISGRRVDGIHNGQLGDEFEGKNATAIFLLHNSLIYFIHYSSIYGSYEEEFDQILSTFLFVEPVEPSVTLRSPNGGEIWTINSEQRIRWDAKNTPPDAKVALKISGSNTGGNILVLRGISTEDSMAVMKVPNANCGIGGDTCGHLQSGNDFVATIELYTGPDYCTHMCPPGTVPPTIIATDESDAHFSIIQD